MGKLFYSAGLAFFVVVISFANVNDALKPVKKS